MKGSLIYPAHSTLQFYSLDIYSYVHIKSLKIKNAVNI